MHNSLNDRVNKMKKNEKKLKMNDIYKRFPIFKND